MKKWFAKMIEWIKGLSFRTGVIVALVCILCYAISFGQMLLPLPIAWKGALWAIFFGLAKTAQYSALLILGKEGMKRLKRLFKKDIDISS